MKQSGIGPGPRSRGMTTELHGTWCVGRHNGVRMAGRYESWFLSARDAEDGRPPRALWIRHTRHRAANAPQGSAALWCTLFGDGAPQAVKQSVTDFPGSAAAGPRGFRGEARARGRMAEWELTLSGDAEPLRHLKPNALYRLPLPKTKLEAPLPDGNASGRVVLDGRVIEVVGWRATAGHNWGAEHAERWVWLHAAGFEDEPEAWLELTLGRVRIGGALTPWVANGALSIGRERHPLRGARGRGRAAGAPGGGARVAPGAPASPPPPAAWRRSCRASARASASPSTPTSMTP